VVLKLNVSTGTGSFGVAIWLLRFHENILEPTCLAQRVNIGRDMRRVELLTGMYREPGLCRLSSNATKSHKFDFANDSVGREAVRCANPVCTVGVAFLRVCESRRHNKQPKKQRGDGNATAHVSLHLETD
jgi:hypothetical protein